MFVGVYIIHLNILKIRADEVRRRYYDTSFFTCLLDVMME